MPPRTCCWVMQCTLPAAAAAAVAVAAVAAVTDVMGKLVGCDESTWYYTS